MLILSRRVGETIMIGDGIQVTILGVKGNQCRVGVTADKSIAVHREEIYDRIKREAEEAKKPPPPVIKQSALTRRPEFHQGARVG